MIPQQQVLPLPAGYVTAEGDVIMGLVVDGRCSLQRRGDGFEVIPVPPWLIVATEGADGRVTFCQVRQGDVEVRRAA